MHYLFVIHQGVVIILLDDVAGIHRFSHSHLLRLRGVLESHLGRHRRRRMLGLADG